MVYYICSLNRFSEHKAVCVYVSGAEALTNVTWMRKDASPPGLCSKKACYSDRNRKGVLNSRECLGVSKTAVDLQGRSG